MIFGAEFTYFEACVSQQPARIPAKFVGASLVIIHCQLLPSSRFVIQQTVAEDEENQVEEEPSAAKNESATDHASQEFARLAS